MLAIGGVVRDWLAPIGIRRALRAAILAGALAAVLATHVYVTFDPIRVRVVRSPVAATAGKIQVGTASIDRTAALEPPFALIARLRNNDGASGRISIRVDGQPICDATVDAGRSRRVDCVVRTWGRTTNHELLFEGAGRAWVLEYLELATHHGGSSGPYTFLILPPDSGRARSPAAGWIVLTWLVVTCLLLLPAPPKLSRAWAALHLAASTLLALSLVVALLATYVSPYNMLVSSGTFARCLCVFFAPRLWWLGRRAVEVRPGRRALLGSVALCVIAAVLVFVAYRTLAVDRLRGQFHGNYSGFLVLSQAAVAQNPILKDRGDVRRTLIVSDGGYDGQFMYFAIFDPFLRLYRETPGKYRSVVDHPPYRFGRIGFSLLAKVFSGDQWQRYPMTMVWLILGSLFLCALFMSLAARSVGLSPAYGGLIVLVPGFWQSLGAALPEPIAAAMLLGGYLCWRRSRWAMAGVLFAISLLVRETGVVFVACVGGAALYSGQRLQALRLALVAIIPLCLWRLYVGWMLFPDWGVRGFLAQPPNFGFPFVGIVDLWKTIAQGQYYPGWPELARAGTWFPVLMVGGFLLALVLAIKRPGAVSIAALVYATIGISLNYEMIWVHVMNGQRGTYEMFIALALCSIDVGRDSRWLRLSVVAFWVATAAYVLYGGLDGLAIRSVLLAPGG